MFQRNIWPFSSSICNIVRNKTSLTVPSHLCLLADSLHSQSHTPVRHFCGKWSLFSHDPSSLRCMGGNSRSYPVETGFIIPIDNHTHQRCCTSSRYVHSTVQQHQNTQHDDGRRGMQDSQTIKITWYSILISVSIAAGMLYIFKWLDEEKELMRSAERIASLNQSGLGRLNWTLTDQHGKRRSYSEFRGRWLMIYFGFCHCPDICPEELEKLISVIKGIDADSGSSDITPVFITLDPERDTVAYMHKYCKDFSEKLVGFTGSREEIDAAAKSYRVYYNYGAKDADGDYIIDHTICMYLVNPDGYLVDVYERRARVSDIIRGSLHHMKEFSKLKKKAFNRS